MLTKLCGVPFLYVVFACAIALMPYSAFAGDLRIIDTHGLVRIQKKIKDQTQAEVVVHLNGTLPESGIVLMNMNGLSADIPAVVVDAHTAKFDGVPEGTWKITAHAGNVTAVKIEVK